MHGDTGSFRLPMRSRNTVPSSPLVSADTFDDPYTEHAAFICRAVRALGVPPALVPEAVKEVFIVAYRDRAEWDDRTRVRSWLFGIAHRVARDYRRKGTAYAAAGQPPAQSEELQLLSELLDQLDDDNKRIALVMVEIESMSVPEVAELTGTPLDAMHTRLRRARIAFSEALGRASTAGAVPELSPEARELLQRSRDALAPAPEEMRAVRAALRAELGAEAWGGGDEESHEAAPLAKAAWKLVAIAVLGVAAAALYAVLSG